MFSSDMMGFLCFKNMFFPRRRLQLGSKETGRPRAGHLSSRARAEAHEIEVSGQVSGKIHVFEAQKNPEPHLQLWRWVRECINHPIWGHTAG